MAILFICPEEGGRPLYALVWKPCEEEEIQTRKQTGDKHIHIEMTVPYIIPILRVGASVQKRADDDLDMPLICSLI